MTEAETVMPVHAGTLLVVDDEAMLLMLVAEKLRDAGFAVVEATDGKTALQLLEANPEIELLISDIKQNARDERVSGGADGTNPAS